MYRPTSVSVSGHGSGRHTFSFLRTIVMYIAGISVVMGLGIFIFHSQLPTVDHISDRELKTIPYVALGTGKLQPGTTTSIAPTPGVKLALAATNNVASHTATAAQSTGTTGGVVHSGVDGLLRKQKIVAGADLSAKPPSNRPELFRSPPPPRSPPPFYVINTTVTDGRGRSDCPGRTVFHRYNDAWIGWQGQWPIGNGHMVSCLCSWSVNAFRGLL